MTDKREMLDVKRGTEYPNVGGAAPAATVARDVSAQVHIAARSAPPALKSESLASHRTPSITAYSLLACVLWDAHDSESSLLSSTPSPFRHGLQE